LIEITAVEPYSHPLRLLLQRPGWIDRFLKMNKSCGLLLVLIVVLYRKEQRRLNG
jgi:hypothetical protein